MTEDYKTGTLTDVQFWKKVPYTLMHILEGCVCVETDWKTGGKADTVSAPYLLM
jgi:hypothetical protein